MTDKQRYTAKEEDQLDFATAVEEIPENRLRELEREQLLRTALQSLDARCQQLVRMLFFESPARPYNEIAKSLTLATGSVGFIRARCLNKLRRKLEEMGFA